MNSQVKNYIDKQPSPQKQILKKLRQVIRSAAPEASEQMSYGVPAFKVGGRTVLYAAFKNHIGLYPTPGVINTFQKELKDYKTSKGTIQFPKDQPMPYALIKKIVKVRL